MPSRTGAVVALYALLSLLWVGVFPHFASPNELTRWALAASLVEDGSLALSPRVLSLLPPGFEDLSEREGRVYSNKAPGATLVALPGYLLVRPIAGPPSASSMRPALVAMRLFGASLPALLLALAASRAARRLGAPPERERVVLLTLLFATPLLAYGLLLFAHALAACALFGAFLLLHLPPTAVVRPRRDAAGGALLGLAVLAEYPAAVPAALLLAILLLVDRRRAARAVTGGLPFALLLALYDAACFGSPLALSSAHERAGSFQSLAATGLFGVSFPSPVTAARLLLDPARGLFLFSPILLLALAALPAARRVTKLPAFAALVGVPASLLLVYAGYPNWHGGWSAGPRYLVAALPFLVLPLALARGGLGESVLLGSSAAAVSLVAFTFPFAPEGVPLPWATLALPLLSDGLVAPNLLHLVWRPLAILVPFGLLLAAAAAALPRRRLPAFALGALLTAAGPLLLPSVRRPSPGVRLQVGYVTDVYFDRPGALEKAWGSPAPIPPRLLARRERERTLPPGPWPF